MKANRYIGGMVFGCLLLAGCRHKPVVVASPPPPRPVMVSVPPPTHRTDALASIPLEAVPSPELQVPRLPMRRFHPLRATKSQLAALDPPPAPVQLGQLTTGGEAANGTLRQATEDLLRSQQRRLAMLPQAAVSLHHQQVQQAKLFLQQADEAWMKLDVEGTRTLAIKAKVLLDEVQA